MHEEGCIKSPSERFRLGQKREDCKAHGTLTAGWFKRAPINPEAYRYEPYRNPVNELPYLLFSPKRGRKPVPMVLYFGGTGEHGTNLVDQLSSTFVQRSPIQFLRVLPEPGKPEVLTLREIGVE